MNSPTGPSVNSPTTIKELAEAMRDHEVVPELELFDVGMADYASFLADKGVEAIRARVTAHSRSRLISSSIVCDRVMVSSRLTMIPSVVSSLPSSNASNSADMTACSISELAARDRIPAA